MSDKERVEIYKDHMIEIRKEGCLGGWPMTFFNVYRESDGLEVIADFTESEDSIDDVFDAMKQRVDDLLLTKGESENLADEYQ